MTTAALTDRVWYLLQPASAARRHAPDLAADFERLLLRQVPVFKSVFRSQSGQRGGAVVADVVGWYQRHDFDEGGQWRVASVDHLGLELRFLGHLAALEAAAWADDRAAEACRAVEAQREFLAHHLGQWGEVAAAAVQRRAAHGPFAALASATAELLAEEGERLRPAPDHPGFPEVVAELPASHLGPARIAEWLLAPSRQWRVPRRRGSGRRRHLDRRAVAALRHQAPVP